MFLCFLAFNGFSQEKSVAGIVFDKGSQDRIAKVNIVNLNTGKSVYNNLNGVFTIQAEPGDQLIFKKQDYYNDTVKVENYLPLAIYMSRTAIQLQEVTIKDSLLSPSAKLALAKKQNSKAYGTLANRDLLVTPKAGGAGGSIDALWNMISREGKNAENLRNYIEQDYRQDVIDYRFNRALAGRITGLKDKQLTDFMQKYRPGYYFVIKASEYEFIASIKTNLKRYLKNPRAYSQNPLTSSN